MPLDLVWLNRYDALKREVFEETGLRVLRIKPDRQTAVVSRGDDGAFAFVPFCAQQQTSGGLSRIGLVFVCEVEDTVPVANPDETKDIVWMSRPALKQLIDRNPEKIFTFQLAALRFYLRKAPSAKSEQIACVFGKPHPGSLTFAFPSSMRWGGD